MKDSRLLTIQHGQARLPWNDDARGWALPGGDVVFNQERALELARRLDYDMRVTPHRFSAQAARASTEGR